MSVFIAPARLEEIKTLLASTSFKEAELQPLPGDASFRRYIRVRKNEQTAMLMDAPPGKEDVRPFVTMADYLHKQGYSAPAILASNVPAGLLLLEDLGEDSFTSVLKRDPALEPELYASAIDVLAKWHDEAKPFAEPSTLLLRQYDREKFLKEYSTFVDWFLPQVIGREKAAALRVEYLALWDDILHGDILANNKWVHLDYHADNLMWLPKRASVKRVGLLDFQDAVYGDAAYDLVSLLEDARRDVPPELAARMINRYLNATGADRERFMAAYAILGAQRNSKIVGYFARLAARDHKLQYLNYLPRVWAHLENDLAHPLLQPLKMWIDRYVPKQYRGVISIKVKSEELLATA